MNKSMFLFSGMSSHSAAVSMEPLGPGATLSDRLRLAASKGQITEAQELYRAGAHFDADRVGNSDWFLKFGSSRDTWANLLFAYRENICPASWSAPLFLLH